MPTAIDTTNEIQQKFLASLEASQKAVVTMVGTWAETVESVFSKLPDLVTSEPVRPTQAMETALGFTEKVLASQREFANQVFQAALPATRAPASTAQASTAQATRTGPAPKG